MPQPSGSSRSDEARCGKNGATCAAISIFTVAIPIVGLSYLAFGDVSPSIGSKTLVLSTVVYRHGDRTPTDTYPNDPYKDSVYWPEGFGTLTKKGKLSAYELGGFLRRRYNGFLSDFYSADDIYVMSSDHDRCLMSAQLTLAGLYPPKDYQIWKQDLNWQPIPVHTTPRHLDQLIVVKKPCPKYDEEFKKAKESIKTTEEESELYKYLTENTGKVIKDIFGAELLYNTLEIEDQSGHELPLWTKTVYPNPLREMAGRSLAFFTNTTTLKKLKGGPLVKEIISHMAQKLVMKLKPNRRLFVYSAHDLTLVSMLRTLGIEEINKPDPSAAVIIELHKALDGSQHFVEVWYKNNSSTEDLHALQLPSCQAPCSLSNFIENANNVTPKNWEKDCSL